MRRREFIEALLAVAAGIAGAAPRPGGVGGDSPSRRLPERVLGRTGVPLPILGLGGAHVGGAGSERAARELVDVALDEGIRFFDTAESYQDGGSERWLGAALEGRRAGVFLMTKTHEPRTRSAESARRHLGESLERLRTDQLDLWQLHSVKTREDVDRAFARGGAFEAMQQARDAGIVRFLGVTGHANPEANLRALDWFDRGMTFDAMQLPVNPMDYHQASFQRRVLPELATRGIGVLAMKTSAEGALLRAGLCTIEECLGYAWSLPVHVAVVGMETPDQVRQDARLAREHAPWTAERLTALRQRLAPRKALALEAYKVRPGR